MEGDFFKENETHWILKEEAWKNQLEDSKEIYGFIYLITNKINGKKYIGKKQITRRVKRKPLKGKKRKRIAFVESDWKNYTGSCKELNEDIARLGKENFTFEILHFCYSKFELAYIEAKLQFENDVLLTDQWYNGIINCRISKAPKSFYANYDRNKIISLCESYSDKSCSSSSQRNPKSI